MSEKSEALRLADSLRDGVPYDEAEIENELRRLAAVEAERDALKQTLHDELAGNLRMRDLGGARPDEPMLTFLERIIAERDALLEALKAFANEIVPNNPNDPIWVNARAAIKAVEEGK